MQRTRLLWVALCASFAASDAAHAVDYFWQNATGGSFTEPSNWLPFAPPGVQGPGGATDTVNFDLGASDGAPYLITDVSGENDRLLVRNDSIHISVFPSYSLASTGGNDPSLVVGRASGDVANLILSGDEFSTFENDVTRIANNADATGALTVQGLQWTNGNLRVGHIGEGSLRIEEGATVTSANASLGHLVGSHGTVRIEDATWTTTGDLIVGREGGALLTLSSGASLTNANVSISSEATGDGTALASDDSSWTILNTLNVGTVGDGILSITGGSVVNSDAFVGGLPASDGVAALSGGEWTTSEVLTIGGPNVGPTAGGSGLVRVTGGRLGADGEIHVLPSGILELQAGVVDANTITVEGPTGQFNFTGGILQVGTFNGSLENDGGNFLPNVGTVVNGDYHAGVNSVLSHLISETAASGLYDSLTVTGAASLDGSLYFSLSAIVEPSPTDSFVLVSADTLAGSLFNVASGQRVDTANGNGSFVVYYGPGSPFDPNQIVLTSYLPRGPSGDYNNNGIVDAADYTVWRDNLGAPPGTLLNDVDGGPIDQDQYDTWQENFGTNGAASLAHATVPEPSVIALLLSGSQFWAIRGPRRRRASL